MRKHLMAIACLAAACFGPMATAASSGAPTTRLPRLPAFLAGADVSYFGYIQHAGGRYKVHGKPEDLLNIFKAAGCNLMRLRLWHRATPTEQKKFGAQATVNNLSYTLLLARRICRMHFVFDLDMHYSDTWADPGHQRIPAAWKHLKFAALRRRVFAYSKRVMWAFRRAGAMPQIVQVGNEINNGLLWPAGKVGYRSPHSFTRMAALLRSAIAGIKAGSGNQQPWLMLQVGDGSRAVLNRLFTAMVRHRVRFDMIGYDNYPFWSGPLDVMRRRMRDLLTRFHKPVLLAETAYPYAGGPPLKKNAGMRFPTTPQGQAQYLAATIRLLRHLPGPPPRGIMWWGAEYLNHPPAFNAAGWGDKSLFDQHGNALPALRVLGRAARR